MKRFEAVPEAKPPIGTARVNDALAQVSTSLLQRQILNIRKNQGSFSSGKHLRVQPLIKPLSTSIGMGMEINLNSRVPVVSIDEKFLDEVLVHQPNEYMHLHTARYFLLSAAAHAFVKDAPFVNALRDQDYPAPMRRAWRWASGLALEEMALKPVQEREVVAACAEAYYEREEALAGDYLFYGHIANLQGIDGPKFRAVDPWVTGLSYPMARPEVVALREEDITTRHRSSTQ